MLVTVNEIKKELRESNKNDNFYSRIFYRKISPYITFFFIKLGISANATTWLSVVMALIGCFLISFSDFFLTLLGFVFIQLWYLLDHVDGEIARFTKTASKEGVYLDVVTHSLVHPIIYFAFGLDAVNSLPQTLLISPLDITLQYRRIILFAGFLTGLSALIIDLSSSLRYQVLIVMAKRRKVSKKYTDVILRFKNIRPVSPTNTLYKIWHVIWHVFCIPGAVWFLTIGSLLGINAILIPLYTIVLFPLAIYSILIRIKSKIDTSY